MPFLGVVVEHAADSSGWIADLPKFTLDALLENLQQALCIRSSAEDEVQEIANETDAWDLIIPFSTGWKEDLSMMAEAKGLGKCKCFDRNGLEIVLIQNDDGHIQVDIEMNGMPGEEQFPLELRENLQRALCVGASSEEIAPSASLDADAWEIHFKGLPGLIDGAGVRTSSSSSSSSSAEALRIKLEEARLEFDPVTDVEDFAERMHNEFERVDIEDEFLKAAIKKQQERRKSQTANLAASRVDDSTEAVTC
jgi:hypothetical protein